MLCISNKVHQFPGLKCSIRCISLREKAYICLPIIKKANEKGAIIAAIMIINTTLKALFMGDKKSYLLRPVRKWLNWIGGRSVRTESMTNFANYLL